MNVHLSKLKQRVKIFRPMTTEDEVGNLIEQGRTEVATVWAMVLPYAAKISDGYAEKVDEVTYRIVIRYREDVQVTDVLQWRGKTLLMSAPPYVLNGGAEVSGHGGKGTGGGWLKKKTEQSAPSKMCTYRYFCNSLSSSSKDGSGCAYFSFV